jgi:methionyl-tRNA synthetase
MKKFKRTLVTAALPYANGPKHIGHIAGAYLPADIYTRYLRNCNEDVLFVSGSDEHGTAIPIQAEKEKCTPTELIDRYHNLLKSNFEKLRISFDVYHRTSDPLHHKTASDFFLNLYKKGLFTEEVSEQYFDEEKQTFLADRYIKGTCPNCGHKDAYGDQCEKCGKTLSPNELIDPVSTLSDKTPVLKQTKHWYLPLQNYEPWLKEWLIEGHKKDWKPNAYGQSKSWIEGGLTQRAMTRDLNWGVKVPLENEEGKVLYVWFDAPIGYISATKAFFEENACGISKYSYPENSVIKTKNVDDWKLWWKNEETRLLHFIGKDNIVFHGIIFPIMLHAEGTYILPDNVPANEFLNLEGDKMSTSRKWSVEMEDYFNAFPGKEDVLRYVLAAIAPETKDADFNWKEFQTRNNSELVGILGNFVNRVLVLTQKFYNGKVPRNCKPGDTENELEHEIQSHKTSIDKSIRDFKFREGLFEFMNIARAGNKYLAESEPWKTIKTDSDLTETILYNSIQICAHLAWWMEPYLPLTAQSLAKMLNFDLKSYMPEKFNQIQTNHVLGEASHLFSNLEDDSIQKQIDKLNQTKSSMLESPTKPKSLLPSKSNISFDEFSKMDLRVGIILKAEKVKKADRLLKIEVDLGFEIRTVVSGIAEQFETEQLIGKQVVVLANLDARKIKGIESKGMILMAEDMDGNLIRISPDIEIKPGSSIS